MCGFHGCDKGYAGEDSGTGHAGCRGPGSPGWERERDTHLLMYSPVRMTLQVWHLKQLTCHCLSSARSDWPCLISSLHPAQSEKTKVSRTSWVPSTSCHHPMPREPIPECHFFPQVATLVLPVPRDPTRKRKGCQISGLWTKDHGVRGKERAPLLFTITTICPRSFSLSSPQCLTYLLHLGA